MASNKLPSDQAQSFKIKCTYHESNEDGYECMFKEKMEIPPPDAKLEFVGTHLTGKNDNDVKSAVFFDFLASKFPSEIGTKFPNLENLFFHSTSIKDITRNDFSDFKNLKNLIINESKIEYLPGDLFADCKHLEDIYFEDNPLTNIEPNILDGLKNLQVVYFGDKYDETEEIGSETASVEAQLEILKMKLILRGKYEKKLTKVVKLQSFIQSDKTLKDLRIKVDDKQFPVHKIFLASKSPVLAEIIRYNPYAEYIMLKDISAVIFENILEYIYTNKLPRDADIMKIYAAAEHLKIEELKDYASEKILTQLDHENALDVLSLGNKYGNDSMKREAFKEIWEMHPTMKWKFEWLNETEKVEQVIDCLQKVRDAEKKLEDISSQN